MVAGTTLTLGSTTSALSNTGAISGTGDTVNIYSFGSFTNTGTFNITNSAINLYGSYTTAQLAVFANQGDTITIDGTLTNTGATLTVGSGSALGTVVLASAGTIVGGTIVDQGSGIEFQGGTLSGVTYDGTLNLSANSSSVYVATSLTATGVNGTGAGTVNLTGTSDDIYFEGNQTFDNATINLGSATGYSDYIDNDDTNNTGSVLTLGPNLVINDNSWAYVYLGSTGSNHTGDGIVNEGTINIEGNDPSYYAEIDPYNFTNQGTINVTNGDTLYIEPTYNLTNTATGEITVSGTGSKLYIEPTSFTNNGTITLSNGTLYLYSYGSFSNTGTLSLTDSTIHLYGSYTTAQLTPLLNNSNSGDTVVIDGTLTNTAAILNVGPGTSLPSVVLASDGTISGGTIVDQGSGLTFSGGTLSGVTYDGTLNLSANSSSVYVATSLTATGVNGTGAGTVNLTGTSDDIYFEGNQTFDNATINLGSATGYSDYIDNDDTNNTGSVLTLGPNLVINDNSWAYVYLGSTGSNHTGDGIVNEGTINIEGNDPSYYAEIDPYNFTNQGTINVTNGDTLYIEPTYNLTNTATGEITVSGTGSKLYIEPTSFTNNGTITLSNGTLYLYSYGSFSNTGTLSLTDSTIHLYGSYTTAQLTPLLNNSNSGDTVVIDGTLTNTAAILNVGPGTSLPSVVLASDGTISGGTIVDQGSGLTFSGGTLSGVTYDGTLNLSANSSSVYVATSLTATGVNGTGAGTVNLTGTSDDIYFEGNQTFDNATINLGSATGYSDYIDNDDTNNTGSVLTLGPNLVINDNSWAYVYLGSTGSNHTGDGIVNEGTINIEGNDPSYYAEIDPYNFTNQGTINVTNGDTLYIEPTYNLTNTATGEITVSGTGSKLYIEPTSFTNNGTITLSNGTLDITSPATGTGSYTIDASSTLEFNSTVASGATVYFGASIGTLMLEQPSSFNGAISASSGSLASGDVIYLKGFNATYTTATPTFNASSDTTSLLVTDPHDSLSVSLTLDGNYSADTFIPSSASGGADIADPPPAPTIVNGGSLDISASSDDTVTFTGATGSLILSDPEGFTGQIIGFTGTAPDASHSDTIDLVGISYDSSSSRNRIIPRPVY